MATGTIRTRDGEEIPIGAANDEQLEYWATRIDRELKAEPNGKWAKQNAAKLRLLQAELSVRREGTARRGGTQQARPAVDTSAIQRHVGSHADARTATEALAKLQEVGHVISPAAAVGSLPEGTELVISAVLIDVDRETYPTAGAERGLSKSALNKLAGAVGIAWSGLASCRLDDSTDPHYCHYRAVGYLRDFSGQLVEIKGEKAVDLREGSSQIKALQSRAESKARRKGGEIADWESQVRDMRLFILEHAETKAQLRAIRTLPGVRTSFTREELAKPFFGVRLQFTGRTADPELRRMFAEHIADSFLGAQGALYGRQLQAPPPASPQVARHAPPPIDTSAEDVPDADEEEENDEDQYPDDDGEAAINGPY